jgi:hypothetical protein
LAHAAPAWSRRLLALFGAACVCSLVPASPVLADGDGTAPPETTIDTGPAGTERIGSADFSFSASEAGSSYECRLDGGAFAPCSTGLTLQVPNGHHDFAVRAIDPAGNVDSTPAQREWWADALLQNGNFETSLRGWSDQGYVVPGWKGANGAPSMVTGGVGGGGAGRLTATSGSTASLYSSPRPINSGGAGVTYTARGSVRSQTPGKSVCLRIREYSGSTQLGAIQKCRTTAGAWADFQPVVYTATTAGSEIDIQVYQAGATAAGDSFDVDGISLTDGRPAAVPTPEPSGDPVLLAAGDVASCWSSGDESVSRLLDTMAGTIAIVGDTEQNHGRADEFAGCYDPSWGRHNARTMPAIGDHEYITSEANGYWDYFGASAGPRGKGWYSYDRGSWHVVVLNSNCGQIGGCGPGSEQYAWLEDDLERNAGDCLGAYFHHPLYSAGGVHGGYPRVRPFWDLLYEHQAEWVLGGNDHNYQRFAPQTPTGELAPDDGVRQFVVGTGGTQHYALGPALPNSEVQNDTAFGVLKFTLHAGSYDWQFVPQEGKTFTDSGSAACSDGSQAPDIAPPETSIDSGPTGTSQSTAARFEFSASEPGSSFECALDGGAFEPCASPRAYADGLSDGEHEFAVRATDAAGNVDPTPASRTWSVDATAPETTIDSGPAGSVVSTTAGFGFSSNEAGSTFECSLDGGPFGACGSPKDYGGLAAGDHAFQVRATDPAGNVDETAASRGWTAVAPSNLLANGSFESSLSGWSGYKTSLALVDGGSDGTKFARVSVTAGVSSASLYTNPRPVNAPGPGMRFTAGGWLRSETPGRTVCLRLREWSGTTQIGAAQTCRPTTGAWQRFNSLSYTANGGDSIELYVYQSTSSIAGDSFDVDGLSLNRVP